MTRLPQTTKATYYQQNPEMYFHMMEQGRQILCSINYIEID